MNGPRETCRRARPGAALLALALGIGAWGGAPAPAAAQFPFGFGMPFPGLYAPWAYYPPPAYYAHYPPPVYYPPPAPAYYPPPAQAGAPAPAAGSPPAGAPAPGAGAAAITYTSRAAFTNATGETCREFTAAQDPGARSTPIYGTACRDAGGQWRVAN